MGQDDERARGGGAGADDRSRRLAEALRENLHRRKRQRRARDDASAPDTEPDAPNTDPSPPDR